MDPATREMNRELEALGDTRLDDSLKGIPLGESVTLATIASRRWNVAAGHLALPIVTLAEPALAHNLATMATYCERHGVLLAPHGKTTMAPQLFARQLEHGAWAMTAATPTQVAVMRRFGIGRIILANQLPDGAALRWIGSELDADPAFELLCLADDPAAVARMDEALRDAGRDVRVAVLVEIGHPGGRAGARSVGEAIEVASAVRRAAHLRLAGVEAFEGALASDVSSEALAVIDELCDRVRQATIGIAREVGFESSEVIVTAGGSTYFDRVVAALSQWPEIDGEVSLVLRSGCYVSHDGGRYETQSPLAQRRAADQDLRLANALTLWGRVLSRPEPDIVLVGAGMRDAPVDVELPRPRECLAGDGTVCDMRGRATTFRVMDQHTFVRVPGDAAVRPGDIMTFDLSHPCTAFDKYRFIPVIDADSNVVDGVLTFF
jgi:D-serine dehydratase